MVKKERFKYRRDERNYKVNPFFNRWLSEFVPQLTKEQYNKIIHGQYVWHAFSYEIIPSNLYLCGDAARRAYNDADKEGAKCYMLWFDDKPTAITTEFDTAEKLESDDGEYSEFYAVGKNYAWTYILTHETSCGLGPYFMVNPKRTGR